MKLLAYLSMGMIGAATLAMAACSDDAQTCDPNCGQGGDGNSSGSGGSGAQGGEGGGAQGGGGSGGEGGQAVCGGFTGAACGDGFFCDYQPSSCGVADGGGVCEPIPDGCEDISLPTCGCDGMVYGNPCEANAAGVDISLAGGCTPPTDKEFPCGAQFCTLDSEYCVRGVSDVGGLDDSYTCEAMPAACAGGPSCDCLMDVPCGNMCMADNLGGLTVTCPGG